MPSEKTKQIVHDLGREFHWGDLVRVKEIRESLFDLNVKEAISYNDYKDLTSIASNLESILKRDKND